MNKSLTLTALSLAANLLLDPSYPALGQQQPPTGLARLQANIERTTGSLNAKWGIYIKCIETGERSPSTPTDMDTMSVIKIPLMVEVFRQIEAGKFALTDRVTMKETDKRPGTGVMRSLDANASLTIKDVITLMIIVSDNTATDLLFEKVGGIEPVNKLMQSYGLKSIRATGPTSVWFKALRESPDLWKFHTKQDAVWTLIAARDGNCSSEFKREAVSKTRANSASIMRVGLQFPASEYVTGFECR